MQAAKLYANYFTILKILESFTLLVLFHILPAKEQIFSSIKKRANKRKSSVETFHAVCIGA